MKLPRDLEPTRAFLSSARVGRRQSFHQARNASLTFQESYNIKMSPAKFFDVNDSHRGPVSATAPSISPLESFLTQRTP